MVTTPAMKKGEYIEAVGRRKTAVARVRLFENKKETFTVNDKDHVDFFPIKTLQKIVEEALRNIDIDKTFFVSVKVRGGGQTSQAEAIRLGISRALVKLQPALRTKLKKAGFLKRDPRVKERKKFGLKKARKAPQWSKR